MIQKFENFDICIIGGSIAGNYLCYLISNTNLKISVIEEHNEIGLPFQCAGIISQKLRSIIDISDEIILNRVKVAKIVAPKGKYIKLSGKGHLGTTQLISLPDIPAEIVSNKVEELLK